MRECRAGVSSLRPREFVDENVMDGGTCYFRVLYVVDSDHYSNVTFHGYA
jgi:hypothetical protein